MVKEKFTPPLENLSGSKPLNPYNLDTLQKIDDIGLCDILSRGNNVAERIRNLPEGRIKMLLQSLRTEVQQHAVNYFQLFEECEKNPLKARLDWLLPIYVKRNWISVKEMLDLQSKTDEEKLQKLKEICLQKANLRAVNESIKRIKINEAIKSNNISVQELLKNHGITGSNLKVRYIQKIDRNGENREHMAIARGNDRDINSRSEMNHDSGSDGEELSMIRTGTREDQTTYATNLYEKMMVNDLSQQVYLIYSGDVLEGIGPNGYPEFNGYSAFHFDNQEGIMQRSLLAVIET